MVINDLEEMYDKFKERWIEIEGEERGKEKLWNQMNNEHLTPLTLAAHYGRKKLLLSLIEKRKRVLWSYGAVTCVLHPLDQLDLDLDLKVKRIERSAHGLDTRKGFQNKPDRLSVLDVIIQDNNPALINPIIISLVEEKWKSFAERILRQRFFMAFFYLIIFLITTILEQMETSGVSAPAGDPSFHNFLLGRRGIRSVQNEFPSNLLPWLLSDRASDSDCWCVV